MSTRTEPDWQAIADDPTPTTTPTPTAAELVSQAYNGKRGEYQRAIAVAGLELIALLLRKNQDYGSSVFDPPILLPEVSANLAIRVRMSDKLKRINQLASNPALVAGESLNDSLDDVIGYRIIEKAKEVLDRKP